jgi:hypothetical protein
MTRWQLIARIPPPIVGGKWQGAKSIEGGTLSWKEFMKAAVTLSPDKLYLLCWQTKSFSSNDLERATAKFLRKNLISRIV